VTQKDLAKRLKVSQQLISRIETGKENISIITLKKIVASLGLTVSMEIKQKIEL
jgi:transcriptional regulator with XRE-family HTH domain